MSDEIEIKARRDIVTQFTVIEIKIAVELVRRDKAAGRWPERVEQILAALRDRLLAEEVIR